MRPVNDAAAETFNLGGLNSGDTYDIYVVATAKEMVAWPASADVFRWTLSKKHISQMMIPWARLGSGYRTDWAGPGYENDLIKEIQRDE